MSRPSKASKQGTAAKAGAAAAKRSIRNVARATSAAPAGKKRAKAAPAKAAPAKAAPAKAAPGKAKSAAARAAAARTAAVKQSYADPALFAPLTAGETADALRTLSEDRRLTNMYKIGRYRVICTEPLVVKPPHWMATHRLARVVVYDYAADRCVDSCVDLDAGVVAHLDINKSQPMLSRDEEAVAISVATSDERVRERLGIGDEPAAAMHYWGRDAGELAFSRRSAAVLFRRPGGHPTLVAVVDLLDNSVTQVVTASQW